MVLVSGQLVRAVGVLEVLILGFVCLAFIVFLRWISRFPSELDRLGADISLYACGSAFSLFAAAFLEGAVLKGANREDTLFVGTLGILLSVMAYFASLQCSRLVRTITNPNLPSGIEDWGDLLYVVKHPKAVLYFTGSVAFGLFPGIFFFILDILRGLSQ